MAVSRIIAPQLERPDVLWLLADKRAEGGLGTELQAAAAGHFLSRFPRRTEEAEVNSGWCGMPWSASVATNGLSRLAWMAPASPHVPKQASGDG